MKITFLGTSAAEGVPAMFCSCEFCRSLRKAHPGFYRARTQVIIDNDISIDFPPEAYSNAMRFGIDLSTLKYVLVTHSHMDHFYAHDFILRGYKYAILETDSLQIYGDGEVCNVFAECTARELKPEVKAGIDVRELRAYKKLDIGAYRVLTLPAIHGTKEEALLYYVESNSKGYLHLYDTGNVADEAINFLAENKAVAAAVALDCTFLDAPHADNTRHMCIDDCMNVVKRLKTAGIANNDTQIIITHFSHNAKPSYDKLSQIESKYSVIAAYDGYTIEI